MKKVNSILFFIVDHRSIFFKKAILVSDCPMSDCPIVSVADCPLGVVLSVVGLSGSVSDCPMSDCPPVSDCLLGVGLSGVGLSSVELASVGLSGSQPEHINLGF